MLTAALFQIESLGRGFVPGDRDGLFGPRGTGDDPLARSPDSAPRAAKPTDFLGSGRHFLHGLGNLERQHLIHATKEALLADGEETAVLR